jgi:hypothetical protein
MTMRPAHLIHLSLKRSAADVYDFLSKPKNYAEWAAVEGPMTQIGPLEWKAQMAFGERIVRFCEPNPYGVLDHAVFAEGEEPLMLPMRVTPNGEGSELTFMFFRRPGISDELYASSIEWINTDFMMLRSILEL